MDRKRTGRPKAKNPKNEIIAFRVTEKELQETIDLCEKLDIRYVDVFRKGLDYWTRKSKR